MIAAPPTTASSGLSCERLGLPALADDPRFTTNPDRLAHRDALLPPIRERLAERSSADWLSALDGIPVTEVQDLAGVARHEQVSAVGMVDEVDGVATVGALCNPRRRAARARHWAADGNHHSAQGCWRSSAIRVESRSCRGRSSLGRMIDLPQKIVCVGLNYRDHAEEQGVALPERPLLFAKWPNTLISSGEAIRIPAISKHVDYEAELGVVIGQRASRVSVDDALGHVRGYVVANDVSGRDLQFADGQWVISEVARHLPAGGRPRTPRATCPMCGRSASSDHWLAR